MGNAFQANMVYPGQLKGMVNKIFSPFSIAGMVDMTSVNTLVPGDAVIITTTAGSGAYLFDKAAATDTPDGFVAYEVKKNSYVAGDAIRVAMAGSIIMLESSAAITRGDSLEFVASGSLVKTNAGTNPVVGKALQSASGANKLIAVRVAGSVITGLVASRGSVVTALTPGATVALNAALGKVFTLTPGEAETINVTGGVAGMEIQIIVLTSGTSSYTLTLGTGFGANAGTLATGTANAKTFVLKFVHNGTSFVEVGRTAAM